MMDGHDLSQLDPYTPPNYCWTSYKPSQQTKPSLELILLVQLFVYNLSFKCVQKTHTIIMVTKI